MPSLPSSSTAAGSATEDWLWEGTAIVHSTFGTGRVAHVGPHKRAVSVTGAGGTQQFCEAHRASYRP
jgi:hypothetical protein